MLLMWQCVWQCCRCRHITRHVNPWTGAASIADVEEQHAAQASPGDLLFLKGNLCQGMAGESVDSFVVPPSLHCFCKMRVLLLL
jgi:hypothetical protein